MNGLYNAVNQSLLTRMLANLFVFIVLIAALGVACFELIAYHNIDNPVSMVLGTGLGYAINLLGINQGVTLQPLQVTPIPTEEKVTNSLK